MIARLSFVGDTLTAPSTTMTTDSTSPASGEDGSACGGALEADQSQELDNGAALSQQSRQSKETAASNRAAVAVACIVSASNTGIPRI
jgi:hypothetical protein